MTAVFSPLSTSSFLPSIHPFIAQNTSEPPPTPEWMAPLWQYFVLIGAILLLVLSIFLFMESVSLQKFAFREMKDAPNPRSGLYIVILGIPVVLYWIATLELMEHLRTYRYPGVLDSRDTYSTWLSQLFLFHQPLKSAPAFALASLLPSVLAVYKFWIVKSTRVDSDGQLGRVRIGSAFIGICASILSMAASAATLLTILLRTG